MPQIQRDPGARNSGAERDWLDLTSHAASASYTLRHKHLLVHHGILAALAPIKAALARTERRV